MRERMIGLSDGDRQIKGQVAKWPTATDCKSVLFGVRWFESILAHSTAARDQAGGMYFKSHRLEVQHVKKVLFIVPVLNKRELAEVAHLVER